MYNIKSVNISTFLSQTGIQTFNLHMFFLQTLFNELMRHSSFRYLIGNDAEVRLYIRVGMSNYQGYFTWTTYIMGGVLLAFGAFLAFETRKVRTTNTEAII